MPISKFLWRYLGLVYNKFSYKIKIIINNKNRFYPYQFRLRIILLKIKKIYNKLIKGKIKYKFNNQILIIKIQVI